MLTNLTPESPGLVAAGTPDMILHSIQRGANYIMHAVPRYLTNSQQWSCELTPLSADSFDFAQDFRLRFSNSRLPAPSSNIVAGSGMGAPPYVVPKLDCTEA